MLWEKSLKFENEESIMTREEQLEFCSVCTKRNFNPKMGIICSITNEKATFDGICTDYNEDEKEKSLEQMQIQSKSDYSNKSINKGRITLFIIGGLYLLVGIYEGFLMAFHTIEFGLIDWAIGLLFLGLGVWSYRDAFVALITGLSIYILLIALLAFADPATIIKGILWKILIIYFLINSIRTARNDGAKIKNQRADLLDDF